MKCFLLHLCCVFVLWNKIENAKITIVSVLAIQFHTKWGLFQSPKLKTVREDAILVANVQFFMEGITHRNLNNINNE